MATAATPECPKTARLERYLREQVEEGEQYFKSRFIAEEIELSSREIGAAFLKLSNASTDLEVEKWSYSGGTTWRVTIGR